MKELTLFALLLCISFVLGSPHWNFGYENRWGENRRTVNDLFQLINYRFRVQPEFNRGRGCQHGRFPVNHQSSTGLPDYQIFYPNIPQQITPNQPTEEPSSPSIDTPENEQIPEDQQSATDLPDYQIFYPNIPQQLPPNQPIGETSTSPPIDEPEDEAIVI